MNRERAESYLRQLAEAELRRARALPAAGIRRPHNTGGLALVGQALAAVGAVDAGTADQIRADLELAVAVRQPGQENPARLMRSLSGRAGTTVALDQALGTGHTRPAPPLASWRVVPVGQVIPIPGGDARHPLLVVAYLQSAGGARFIMAGWPFHPLTAAPIRATSVKRAWKINPMAFAWCHRAGPDFSSGFSSPLPVSRRRAGGVKLERPQPRSGEDERA